MLAIYRVWKVALILAQYLFTALRAVPFQWAACTALAGIALASNYATASTLDIDLVVPIDWQGHAKATSLNIVSLLPSNDDGVLVAGKADPAHGGYEKMDSSFHPQWQLRIEEDQSVNIAKVLFRASDGGAWGVGVVSQSERLPWIDYLVRIDSSCRLMWRHDVTADGRAHQI